MIIILLAYFKERHLKITARFKNHNFWESYHLLNSILTIQHQSLLHRRAPEFKVTNIQLNYEVIDSFAHRSKHFITWNELWGLRNDYVKQSHVNDSHSESTNIFLMMKTAAMNSSNCEQKTVWFAYLQDVIENPLRKFPFFIISSRIYLSSTITRPPNWGCFHC